MTDDLDGLPVWVLWIVGPWVLMHFIYDTTVGTALSREGRANGLDPPFGFRGYVAVLDEINRRARDGDLVARAVKVFDYVIMAGLAGLVLYRLFVR